MGPNQRAQHVQGPKAVRLLASSLRDVGQGQNRLRAKCASGHRVGEEARQHVDGPHRTTGAAINTTRVIMPDGAPIPCQPFVTASGDGLRVGGRPLFLNGFKLAWVSYPNFHASTGAKTLPYTLATLPTPPTPPCEPESVAEERWLPWFDAPLSKPGPAATPYVERAHQPPAACYHAQIPLTVNTVEQQRRAVGAAA